jgi:hypothetical protein
MSESRPRASRAEVAEAILESRAYYREGRSLLRHTPGRGVLVRAAILKEAHRLNWNETKARKARQFAMLYSRDQVHDLCRSLRVHEPHFGTAHVGVLVTVPDARERAKLQRWCVAEDIAVTDLELEVRRRFGRRTFGGRRRKVADDPARALLQLDGMAVSWLRWHAVAAAEPEGNAQGQSVLDRLPDAVAAEARKVHRTMLRLYDAVAKELKRARARGQRTGSR